MKKNLSKRGISRRDFLKLTAAAGDEHLICGIASPDGKHFAPAP